jgi:hypothetical protein
VSLKRTGLRRDTEAARAFQQRGRESSARSLRASGREAARKSPPKRRPISPASLEQRRYVKQAGSCIACGAKESDYVKLTFAHWWPRGRGGCDSELCGFVLCCRPGGTGCHDRQERGEIDLWAIIRTDWDRWRDRFCHALEHTDPVSLFQHLAASRIQWGADRPADGTVEPNPPEWRDWAGGDC